MIAIIPARGGSKGLPQKNIKNMLGKPLIAYTIEAALKSQYITNVIVSTDDTDIYNTAIKFGALKTFLRPSELAGDDSLAVDNYIYTINRLNQEHGFKIDNFIVLQPTSPLRESRDIDNAIELFYEKNADSVISYTEEHHPISWHKHINEDGRFEDIFPQNLNNRQENKVTYFPNGAIFIFRFKLILMKQYYSENSFAYIMNRENSIDIDTLEDFNYAEYLLRKRNE